MPSRLFPAPDARTFATPNLYHWFQQLSDQEKKWLTDKSSLTKKLQELTNEKIRLVLMCDGWGKESPAYYNRLGISDSTTPIWVRRIVWEYEKKTWLACTVVIPKSSIFLGYTDELTQVGQGSIGNVLFKDPTLKSSEFMFHDEHRNSITRSRVLTYKGYPLLIVETFLPAFFEGLRTLTLTAPTTQEPSLTSKL